MELDGSNYDFLVDDPSTGEAFEKLYAPWPLRLYLLKGATIEWIAQPKNANYDIAVRELLEKLHLIAQ
jgi:hypothetical protein